MPDPETTTDAGTVTEETPVETTEVPEVTETPADDSADGDEDGSEADAAAQEAAGKTNVPYSRFKNVNERRKAAELENAELKAKLTALTPKEEVKPTEPGTKLKRALTPAPANMTPIEQMEHYALQTLESHPEIIDKRIKELLGMEPDMAAATLARNAVSNRAQIKAEFEKACADRGLNPKDPKLQAVVGSAMDTKQFGSFGEAMDVFVKPKTNGTAPRKVVGKGAESEGVDVGGLSRVRVLPKNAKEAGVLAAKGQAIEHVSVTDILKSF